MNELDKPIIGITTDLKEKENSIENAYSVAIDHYGGVPFLIPTIERHSKNYIKDVVKFIDGLLIPGSRDMDPKFYNEKVGSKINPMNINRTLTEFDIMEESIKLSKPILGICGGMQFINVFYGGSIHQDIKECLPKAENHEKGVVHIVKINENSNLKRMCGKLDAEVNSYHHQAINAVGKSLTVGAEAQDGIVESIENESDNVFAVQWHPELVFDDVSRAIFEDFINKSQKIIS